MDNFNKTTEDSYKKDDYNPNISIGALRERDIDLLILEEASCSINFLKWLLNLSGIQSTPLRIIKTQVSALQSTGESDIEIWYEDFNNKINILLLENKIDANFQLNQAKRYIERGENYKAQDICNSYYTVLVAPNIYLNRSTKNLGFDFQIGYEQLVEWFKSEQSLLDDSRRNFKITLINRAIEKAELGYCQIEDAAVTDFWKHYWTKALDITPELRLAEPEGKPARSLWARFKTPEFSNKITFIHKFDKGNLDIQFSSQADRFLEFKNVVNNLLTTDLKLEKTGRSIVIRKKVPIVDPAINFQLQEENVIIALIEAKKLLSWFTDSYLKFQKALHQEDQPQATALHIP